MENIDFIIKSEILKHHIGEYQTKSSLISIGPGAIGSVIGNNDLNMFVHAFSTEGEVNGRATGSGISLDITPVTMLTKIFKHKIFKGNFKITNSHATNTLYVELLRVTPILHL